MRITTDEKGYVTGWSIAGDEEGILCQDPADFDRFAAFYPGYRYENGKLTEAVIYGDEGNSGTVEYGGKVIEFTIPSGGSVVLNNASF